MIVSRDNFQSIVDRLSAPGIYGLDTETTGLRRTDRLFSIILADEEQGYYFSFNERPDHLGNLVPEEYRLPREWIVRLEPVVENLGSTFFIHNAKFDLSMLSRDGLEVLGTVHCTEAMERVLKNNILGYKPYSLASCAKRRGWAKDARVDEYLKKHRLITKITVPGKAKIVELKHFDQVPFHLMMEYATQDAILHRQLGLDQVAGLEHLDATAPVLAPKLIPLMHNERKLTKACYRIEETGILINRAYTEKALAYTQQAAASAMQDFQALTSIPYSDSDTTIVAAFKNFGIELPKTPTGRPCTKKEVLDALDNPVADKIREIRGHQKLAATYYSSFLYFADDQDLIHAGMRQGGTETSRFSYGDPNLQNLPKEDEPEDFAKSFVVRQCFEPLNSEWCFVPIDFKQQEFRMMLDYAGERGLIDAIMAGMDVHDATAQLMGVPRKQAKTLNFGLLYGMGAAKLAKALGITLREAYALKALYFEKLPRVQVFIRNVMGTGEKRGFIWNWFGFRNHLFSSEYAYILPNHLIQGGCAQVLRVAMVLIDEYLCRHRLRSKVLAQVHDELLFQMHRSELHHVEPLKKLMEGVYKPKNGLYLECSVEHSWKSWAKRDQVKGAPSAAA